MTFAYMDELERVVLELRDDREVRAVVITAAGDEHFSVGMDLKQLVAEAGRAAGSRRCSTSVCACCRSSSTSTSR